MYIYIYIYIYIYTFSLFSYTGEKIIKTSFIDIFMYFILFRKSYIFVQFSKFNHLFIININTIKYQCQKQFDCASLGLFCLLYHSYI